MAEHNNTHKIITFYGYQVSPSDYDTISSFCEDKNIKGVVDRINMQVEIAAVYGYHEKLPQVENEIYLMDEIEIIKVPAVEEGGGDVLMIVGNSPILEKKSQEAIEKLKKLEYDVITEEPIIGVPLAPAGEIDEDKLEELTFNLRNYLKDDRITFFELRTSYLSEEDYEAMMDGELEI